MTAQDRLNHEVEAYNLSHASENKIHDDTVAGKLGFEGGLVPGVEVFAYTAHVPVAYYGIEFLERGRLEARFAKPVYDGRRARVIGAVEGDGLALRVESEGQLCATGHASMPAQPAPSPAPSSYAFAMPPSENMRPPN